LFTGSGDGKGLPKTITAAIEQDFGSLFAWQREFIALAQALNGQSGWVVLSFGRQDGRLYNQLVDDGSQAVIDAAPLLVLDMYEHAYQPEFGANATAYIDAFLRNVDWTAVASRLKQATDRPLLVEKNTADGITVEELAARRAAGESIQLIDARPRFSFSRSTDMIEGAVCRDPDRVYEWSAQLAADKPVVVYCAYGFNVGCAVAGVLRERGFDARFLEGGISAWLGIDGARTRAVELPASAA
jgi:Fe-Mn family superoxide dismutase